MFAEAKADNVIWVWNPNEKSFPDFKWNNEILYYPGDEYVDIVGLTGYNTGTYYQGELWRSFTDIYNPLYQKMERMSEKPLIITEFSSSSVGGNKEEWVKNMFANIDKYPRIKVAIWWNGCDWDRDVNIARPYFIDEPGSLLNVFRDNLEDKSICEEN
jgi:beta-mannanase